MKLFVVAALLAFSAAVCSAEPSKISTCSTASVTEAGQRHSVNACPVIRLAEDKRCTCTTYAGTKCTGPCLSAGKPYGCACK
jgi:hypothetical protein